MDPYYQPRAPFRERYDFSWDRRFSFRRPPVHTAEDKRLFDGDRPDTQALIKELVEFDRSFIDPPCFTYKALTGFLAMTDLRMLTNNTQRGLRLSKLASIDDRRDRNAADELVRNWEADTYAILPHEGLGVFHCALNERELYLRLKEERTVNRAERRLIYIANLTPLCALGLVATVSVRSAHYIRAYLERYLVKRAYFQVSLDSVGFAMEFHFPFLAVREGVASRDTRELRNSELMPASLDPKDPDIFYHEAQVSFLLVGADEWFWTVYCCVDTFVGGERQPTWYVEEGWDGPSGGDNLAKQPVWNPREYFLIVLSRRMNQAMKEWSNVIATLDLRLESYVVIYPKTCYYPLIGLQERDHEKIIGMDRFFDDDSLSGTKRYTLAVSVIRRFYDVLLKTLEAWDYFAASELRYFDTNSEMLERIWSEYKARLQSDVSELRFLQRSLLQKIQNFDRMKDELINVSALRESRAATGQGRNIGVLTYMTVAYLPFGLGTGIFSMAMIDSGTRWIYWIITTLILGVVTFSIAFRPFVVSFWQRRRSIVR